MATTVETVATAGGAVAPDFPVAWERPGDEQLFWTRDVMHFPSQLQPAAESLLARMLFGAGFNRASEGLALPVRVRARLINTYHYQAIYPVGAPQEQASGAQPQGHQGGMDSAVERLATDWQDELLPEVRGYLAAWEGFALAGATMPQLLAHLDETLTWADRLGEIHTLAGAATLLALSFFDELYHDLFAGDTFDAYRLLQGFPNKSLEADQALWALGRRARALPAVRRALAERPAGEVVAALVAEDDAGARDFLAALRAFHDQYGRRADLFYDVAVVHWIEDPTPAIERLRGYLTQPDRDLEAGRRAQAAERERLAAEARERLAGYPAPVVARFTTLLAAAQAATAIQEDHNYWIDQRAVYQVRRVLQEFGRRFAAAGVLADADDVFALTLDEIRVTAAALPRLDRRELVRERAAELARFRAVAPPPALGTPPLAPPPDDPLGRAIGKFFGAPPPPSPEPGVLRGHAGAPGSARGPARVLRSLAEADRLRPGDVLVAPTTAPPWTPLFATVAAVVTDTGGILSHCAVVAREYGIPAVVGAGLATAVIQDGQLVEVDGDAGVVRVVA
ncbi:MAG TPA: PEP-utilizing enzyme [Thermomicrobiales bacterium]|nr:PEP-utilizing enzyme [Thermomicrobiales bacterium]